MKRLLKAVWKEIFKNLILIAAGISGLSLLYAVVLTSRGINIPFERIIPILLIFLCFSVAYLHQLARESQEPKGIYIKGNRNQIGNHNSINFNDEEDDKR